MSIRIDKEELLSCFFRQTEWHLREIARATNMHPSSASKHLENFIKEGLLGKKENRGVMLYRPTKSEIFLMKKRHWNEEQLRKSGLLEFLDKKLAYPTIILFGSYASGEDHEKSDIDLFVIAAEKKPLNLSSYEMRLGKEIQLFVHTPEEFRELRKSSVELINNVINGNVLSGFVEVL